MGMMDLADTLWSANDACDVLWPPSALNSHPEQPSAADAVARVLEETCFRALPETSPSTGMALAAGVRPGCLIEDDARSRSPRRSAQASGQTRQRSRSPRSAQTACTDSAAQPQASFEDKDIDTPNTNAGPEDSDVDSAGTEDSDGDSNKASCASSQAGDTDNHHSVRVQSIAAPFQVCLLSGDCLVDAQSVWLQEKPSTEPVDRRAVPGHMDHDTTTEPDWGDHTTDNEVDGAAELLGLMNEVPDLETTITSCSIDPCHRRSEQIKAVTTRIRDEVALGAERLEGLGEGAGALGAGAGALRADLEREHWEPNVEFLQEVEIEMLHCEMFPWFHRMDWKVRSFDDAFCYGCQVITSLLERGACVSIGITKSIKRRWEREDCGYSGLGYKFIVPIYAAPTSKPKGHRFSHVSAGAMERALISTFHHLFQCLNDLQGGEGASLGIGYTYVSVLEQHKLGEMMAISEERRRANKRMRR